MKKKNNLIESNYHKGVAYPAPLRAAALRDYLGGMSGSAVARKYSLPDSSILSHWKRKFASSKELKSSTTMVRRRNKRFLQSDMESAQSERIRELERALQQSRKALELKEREVKDLELHLQLNNTMLDLAEEQFGLPIRKNFGSKQ